MYSKKRKTEKITYNLFDRGYKHNGQSRTNYNHNAVIELINSDQVQEMVDKGVMLGYFGHQIRQRFGMIPPETVNIDGKLVYLEPAFKTIHLKAYKNGDVEHIAEFLPTDAGEHALNQYKANVGGFSTAIDYIPSVNGNDPVGFYGFDYVLQTNYATNVGNGKVFDGLFLPKGGIDAGIICSFDGLNDAMRQQPQAEALARTLENSILADMQLITRSNELNRSYYTHQQEEARKKAKENYQKECASSLKGTVVRGFDTIWSEAQQKANLISQSFEISKIGEKKPKKDINEGSFKNRFENGAF